MLATLEGVVGVRILRVGPGRDAGECGGEAFAHVACDRVLSGQRIARWSVDHQRRQYRRLVCRVNQGGSHPDT